MPLKRDNDGKDDTRLINSDAKICPKLEQDIGSLKDTFESFKSNVDNVKAEVDKLDTFTKSNDVNFKQAALTALSPITPFRRISSLPDNVEDGNYERAAGLAALAVVNLPEDTRDLKAAWNQVVHGKVPTYCKDCQVRFSFFRGTLLEPVLGKIGKLGLFLRKQDRILSDTRFGKFIRDKLGISINFLESEGTGRFFKKAIVDPETGETVLKEIEVLAYKVEGKPLAQLVGTALLRVPVLSVATLSLLEIPNIVKKIKNADGTKNKLAVGSKQTLKSAVNVTSITAGIAIVGALLKGKGPAFSLLGMGIGSVIGAITSKTVQNEIDHMTNKK